MEAPVYKPRKGETIFRAARQAIELAKTVNGRQSVLLFNGIRVKCFSNSSHLDVAIEYQNQLPQNNGPRELQPEIVEDDQ